ncbi:carbonic anhydrase 14 isoform X1 [Varanus komodoensis]|uniref:carbonic anhydrase 14 isoform X1 n=2 Tax=Varanus komodoensis TaxID=61221 RepID=UPI001CF7C0B1|nr:carbonic anhydrase 14 isoform X1 [Varanus komodoensis]
MLLALTFFLQAFSQALAGSGGSHWTYEGPHGQEHWPDSYPDCGRQAQSPIDIQTGSVQYDPSLLPVEPEGYRDPSGSTFTLTNNGHTVQLSLPQSLRLHGLPSKYSAVQLHLHWGGKGHPKGSEHQVDGRAFPAELHVVHFNSDKYANVSEAKDKPDGLAVLGVFLEVGSAENPAYNHILDHLEDIQYTEQETPVAAFDVRGLLPAHLGHYFRYNGSLTTPPCHQSVLWTVFHQPARLSAAQLEKLHKSVYATEEETSPAVLLLDNFRAPQPLNQRTVLASFPAGPSGYSAGEIAAIIFGVLLGCLSIFLAGWIVAKRIREKRMQEQKGVVFTASSRRAIAD